MHHDGLVFEHLSFSQLIWPCVSLKAFNLLLLLLPDYFLKHG